MPRAMATGSMRAAGPMRWSAGSACSLGIAVLLSAAEGVKSPPKAGDAVHAYRLISKPEVLGALEVGVRSSRKVRLHAHVYGPTEDHLIEEAEEMVALTRREEEEVKRSELSKSGFEDPTTWGPHLWAYLHAMAWSVGADMDKAELSHYFKKTLPAILPCGSCRDNYLKHLKVLKDVDEVLKKGDRQELGCWVVDLHNQVNQELGKPLKECDVAFREFSRQVARESQEAGGNVTKGTIGLEAQDREGNATISEANQPGANITIGEAM